MPLIVGGQPRTRGRSWVLVVGAVPFLLIAPLAIPIVHPVDVTLGGMRFTADAGRYGDAGLPQGLSMSQSIGVTQVDFCLGDWLYWVDIGRVDAKGFQRG